MGMWHRRGARLGGALLLGVLVASVFAAAPAPAQGTAFCGPDDMPETGLQGQTPLADMASGRSQEPYFCGLRIVGYSDILNRGANWQLARVDHCAYVATLKNVFLAPNDPVTTRDPAGVAVIDVSDPTDPQVTEILREPGSIDSVETMTAIDTGQRQVLAAGSYSGGGGVVGLDAVPPHTGLPSDDYVTPALDIYDVSGDCARPRHMATALWPRNAHDITLSPDGMRVYGTYLDEDAPRIMVMDISDLAAPRLVADVALTYPDGTSTNCHTVHFDADETRLYCASGTLSSAAENAAVGGPSIWDVSEISAGVEDPEVRFVGEAAEGGQGWHHAVPAMIGGRPHLVAANELSIGGCADARPWIWDISDEAAPRRVGEFALEVQTNCDDPSVQAEDRLGNYASHYNSVDDPFGDTKLGLFGMTGAGLRVVDLRDPANPREVAYYKPGANPVTTLQPAGAHVSNFYYNPDVTDACGSRNWYVPETGQIWFTCQSNGFFIAELSPEVREYMDLDDPAPTGPVVVREAGEDRTETAAQVARVGFDAAESVVLARADDFAEALAGGPLAADRDAPMLLTDRNRLSPAARAQIERLGATRAVLLGGAAAIRPEVEAELVAMGVVVERIAGANRFATAAAVARALSEAPSRVFVTEGEHVDPSRGWPDALAASPFAAFAGEPILLVNAERYPEETAAVLDELAPDEVVVVGGSTAVGEDVAAQVAAEGRTVRRIAGTTRYATAALVRDEAVAAGMDANRLWLATGRSVPDALAAGPAVAALGESFALVDGQDLDGSPHTVALLEAIAGSLERLTLVGGNAAIGEDVEQQVRALVGAGEG